MNILSSVGKRLIYSLILILAVIVLNFTLIHLSPGDIAQTIAGQMGGVNADTMAELRQTYNLDKTLPEQLILYIGKVFQGDLGYSYFFNKPVFTLIFERLGATALLVLSSLVVSVIIGVFLGIISATKPYGIFSNFITVFALIGWSMPVFWLGIIVLIVFAGYFPIFPVSGMETIGIEKGGFIHMMDVLHHLVLPMFTLGFIYIAQYALLARSVMIEVLGADYIRTAKAKGLPPRKVIYKHALKNSMLPVVTMIGLQMGYLFSGAIMVETVFNWPGLGLLAFESIMRRDTPTILGILFFSTVMVVVANMITDFSYRLLDPRIRKG